MTEPGIREKDKPLLARNLAPEQKDGFQGQLKSILNSGNGLVSQTMGRAGVFVDNQVQTNIPPLSEFDHIAGNLAKTVSVDVKSESDKARGSRLKDAWEDLANIANAGVRELLNDDMEGAELDSRIRELRTRISNGKGNIREVFPGLGNYVQKINASLRGAQESAGKIYLDDPNVADQADQIGEFKAELGRLLNHIDPELAIGRQIDDSQYPKIMDCVGQIKKLVDTIAETRLARS